MIAAHPLTIAEIFDRAVTVVVRRWQPVLLLSILTQVPDALVVVLSRGHDDAGWAILLSMVLSLVVGALSLAALVRAIGDPNAGLGGLALLRGALRDYPRSFGSILLVYLVVVGGAAVSAVPLGVLATTVGAIAGARAGTIATMAAAIALVVLFGPPVILATAVGYATTILERVGPWRGMGAAIARVKAGGMRAWLLGFAVLAIEGVPALAVDGPLRPVAHRTGMWWLLLVEPVVSAAASVAYGTAVTTIAALDYRNRREGADLHAALDAGTPA